MVVDVKKTDDLQESYEIENLRNYIATLEERLQNAEIEKNEWK